MAEVKIDSKLFQERIGHFVTSWKNDLRSKDGLFSGANTIVITAGKVEDSVDISKSAAVHVSDLFHHRAHARHLTPVLP